MSYFKYKEDITNPQIISKFKFFKDKVPYIRDPKIVPEIRLNKDSNLFIGYPLTINTKVTGLHVRGSKDNNDFFQYSFKVKGETKLLYKLTFHKDKLLLEQIKLEYIHRVICSCTYEYSDIQEYLYNQCVFKDYKNN